MRRSLVMLLVVAAGRLPGQGPYPPPGRLVDIGGRRFHLNCSGRGTPVVILLAGGGAFSIDWALVQPHLAGTTRVCSYDRAGLGWSDPGPAEETVEQTVADLHRLLQAAHERGPYVLVGASIGGIYIRGYQHAFPHDVAGLVFANSSHHVGILVRGNPDLIWNLSEDDVRSAFPLHASAKGPAPTHEGDPFDRLSPHLRAVRLWLDRRLWEKWDPAKTGPQSMLSWRKEFLRELEEQCSGLEHPLGRLPVVVLSSDESASELARQHKLKHPFCDRSDAGDGLELLSSNTLYVVAAGSGHEIHLYQPYLVTRTLERIVLAVRNRIPLGQSVGAIADSAWVGQRVLMLKGLGEVHSPSDSTRLATAVGINLVAPISRREGRRLWIMSTSGGDSGWVDSVDVLRLADAIPYFTRLIERQADNWDAYLRRAEAEHALNRRDAATADYSKAIELHPAEAFLYLRRGRHYNSLRACDRALSDFGKAITLAPTSAPHGYNLVAELYSLESTVYSGCPDSTRRDPRKAIEAIRHAIALDSSRGGARGFVILAGAYASSGDLAEAIKLMKQALTVPGAAPSYRKDWQRQLEEYDGPSLLTRPSGLERGLPRASQPDMSVVQSASVQSELLFDEEKRFYTGEGMGS